MPLTDLEPYKVIPGETSSAVKFNNFVQAVENELAAVDNDNVAASAGILVAKLAPGAEGTFLKVTGGVATWSPGSGAAGYGITLPASPADGDRFILTDSLTLPTYHWELRYHSTSTHVDKWEFLGGAPGYNGVQEGGAFEATSSGTYAALSTPGPIFALPRAGVYDITIGAQIGSLNNSRALMSYDIGATAAVDADAIEGDSDGLSNMHQMRTQRKTGLTAVTLTCKYRVGAGQQQFSQRFISVTPVRLS